MSCEAANMPVEALDHLGLSILDHAFVKQVKQGNSVARDLPSTGSEANTTICVIYILDIDSHCPYLLSGETIFQLTSY